jgi:hypothetical protein
MTLPEKRQSLYAESAQGGLMATAERELRVAQNQRWFRSLVKEVDREAGLKP